MKKNLYIKRADIIIVLIALGLTGFSTFAVYARPRNTAQVTIQGFKQKWLFPLSADETVTVAGPIGDTVIRIQNNQAWVESSPCTNKTCVAGGHIHKSGQWLACLPNEVFLLVEGTETSGETLRKGAHAPDATAW
jgi:hypothetical protein